MPNADIIPRFRRLIAMLQEDIAKLEELPGPPPLMGAEAMAWDALQQEKEAIEALKQAKQVLEDAITRWESL